MGSIAINPQFPPLPANCFDRWLSDYVANGVPPNWDRLWFHPGRVPQSAELNEIQSMLWTYLDRVCATLFTEGQVISGLVPTLAGTTVTVTAGMMYIQGRIRAIAGGTATITGTGNETVGLLYTMNDLEPETTPELLNPVTSVIVGPQQYSLSGAGRQSMTFAWASDSSAANYTPVFYYVNGVLQVPPYVVMSPYYQMTYSATPVFDCSKGTQTMVTFGFPLNGNVTSSTLINVQPGKAVKFIISNPSGTAYTFVWPTGNLYGAGSPVPSGAWPAGENFVQSFISSVGNIFADGVMTVLP